MPSPDPDRTPQPEPGDPTGHPPPGVERPELPGLESLRERTIAESERVTPRAESESRPGIPPGLQEQSTAADAEARKRRPDPYWLPRLVAWTRRKRNLLWAGVAALVLATAAYGWPRKLDEHDFPGWRLVQKATDQFAKGEQVLLHVGPGGVEAFVGQIQLGEGDRDTDATSAMEQARQARDLAGVERELARAQDPERKPDGEKKPALSPWSAEMLERTKEEPLEFYRIRLWDCCQQDGDVVHVLVNGKLFASVTLLHKGATLSIPVPKGGRVAVTLVGFKDGGGGITVGCRTSQGDHFLRRMFEGEQVPLGRLQGIR
jgi:hypothetical protein